MCNKENSKEDPINNFEVALQMRNFEIEQLAQRNNFLIAFNRQKFRMVIGTEWNAENQPKNACCAFHVRIPALITLSSSKPAVKSRILEHLRSRLTINTGWRMPIFLPNDNDT